MRREMPKRSTHQAFLNLQDFLKSAITEGAYAPGSQLPTERELAAKFRISRDATRRALAKLEKEGLLQRHVGRGTFVRRPADDRPLVSLPEGSASPVEYIEARLCLEPTLARIIVTSATAADFFQIDQLLLRGERATNREEYELADAEFHQCLAQATHNKLVIAMYNMVHTVRHEQAMWLNLRKLSGKIADQRDLFQAEHIKIRDALMRRDAENASELMAEHVRATRRRILDF
jgi:DNA-binding FadR family transcriptional regulator